MTAAVDFYYNPLSPPSRCAWMVLEELGLPYNEHIIDIFSGEQKTEAYKKINVRQKIPGLKDGELGIGESRAIAAYLVDQYGSENGKQSLYPRDPKKRAVVDQHLYIGDNVWDQILAYLNLGNVLFGDGLMQNEKVDGVKNALQMIESFLEKHRFTASDDFTIADIFYYAAISMLDATDFDEFASYPKVAAWRKEISELPYHQKTWRDPAVKFRAFFQAKLTENAGKH